MNILKRDLYIKYIAAITILFIVYSYHGTDYSQYTLVKYNMNYTELGNV